MKRFRLHLVLFAVSIPTVTQPPLQSLYFSLFLSPAPHKYVLKDQFGVQHWSEDNIKSQGGALIVGTAEVQNPAGSQDIAGILNTKVHDRVFNPTLFAGGDIGAQVNAAVASCSSSLNCTILVPPGSYSQRTDITLPGANVHLIGPGAVLVGAGGVTHMVTVSGNSDSVEGITFNLGGNAQYAVLVVGSNATVKNNTFLGVGNYGIVAAYAGSGLGIINNIFESDSDGRAPAPISILFTADYRVIGNHMVNTAGFGITATGSSHGVISGNDFYQTPFTTTVVAAPSQTRYSFTLSSYATRIGVHVNGVTVATKSITNTSGNDWTVVLPVAPAAGANVTFVGWQALENIQVNSQSFDVTVIGNTMDGTGDSGIDVVSDYHATLLQSTTATTNQTVFNFVGAPTFFGVVEVSGRILGGNVVLNGGPVRTSTNHYTVTLASPQPAGTVVSFMDFTITANVPADYPGSVAVVGNTVRNAAATGIGIELAIPNVVITGNTVADCGLAVTDINFSSGIFVAGSVGAVVKNNTITNSLTVPSMLVGIALLYVVNDDGSLDKHVKIGRNVFNGTFQSALSIPNSSPGFRASGVDVEGENYRYPERVNIDGNWTMILLNTKYFTYSAAGITLTRDTKNVMGGVASISWPGNGGFGSNFVNIYPCEGDFFKTNSIAKLSWWAKVNGGTMGMQLFSTVGGSTIPIEVDASGTGWKQYSIYLSTNGVTPGSIFARLVGSGKGNFANITFSMTPLDNTSTALTTESEKKLYKH